MARSIATVLAIPELLEGILFELPPLDLLLATRVNKAFQTQIRSSTRIQRKLFFKPPAINDEANENAINPFLERILRGVLGHCNATISYSIYVDDGRSARTTTLRDQSTEHSLQSVLAEQLLQLYVVCDDHAKPPKAVADQSWRTMLVAHRPVYVQVAYSTLFAGLLENITDDAMDVTTIEDLMNMIIPTVIDLYFYESTHGQ